jgi:GNAT superfamily N-acetyltransferase
MIVRLHNLSARPPAWSDLNAVTRLMVACERADAGVSHVTEEEIETNWHVTDFALKTDAWVIVTNRGQIVGYADVRHSGVQQLTSLLRVHPDYLGRGIGTLLVWLTEERARHLMQTMPLDQRVTLINNICSLNERALHLFEREGYMLARRYWSLSIQEEGDMSSPFEGYEQRNWLQIDLSADAYNLLGKPQQAVRTGIYVMRQYYVFEKELREPQALQIEQAIALPCVSV